VAFSANSLNALPQVERVILNALVIAALRCWNLLCLQREESNAALRQLPLA
jgi:hypothetical protein